MWLCEHDMLFAIYMLHLIFTWMKYFKTSVSSPSFFFLSVASLVSDILLKRRGLFSVAHIYLFLSQYQQTTGRECRIKVRMKNYGKIFGKSRQRQRYDIEEQCALDMQLNPENSSIMSLQICLAPTTSLEVPSSQRQ